MSKRSTRKISLQATDPLTLFFKGLDEKDIEFLGNLLSKHGVEVRINKIGMLVIKCAQETSEQLRQNFVRLNRLGRKIVFKDIEKAVKGEVEGEATFGDIDWTRFSLRHKSGTTTTVKPKTENQQNLINQIVAKKIIFANGPAGTGKTFIALATAMKYFDSGLVEKIVLTRPAVTSEDFGFLPGDIDDKLGPFLFPVFDILTQLIGNERKDRLLLKKDIEILPVAFTRGITVGSSFRPTIGIVDEAQNLTYKQLKMIVTRIGDHPNSKIIFSGDMSQSDLREKNARDFRIVQEVLSKSKWVGSVDFDKDDIVRSEAVKEALQLFEEYEDRHGPTK